jgi:hypothetical protein
MVLLLSRGSEQQEQNSKAHSQTDRRGSAGTHPLLVGQWTRPALRAGGYVLARRQPRTSQIVPWSAQDRAEKTRQERSALSNTTGRDAPDSREPSNGDRRFRAAQSRRKNTSARGGPRLGQRRRSAGAVSKPNSNRPSESWRPKTLRRRSELNRCRSRQRN